MIRYTVSRCGQGYRVEYRGYDKLCIYFNNFKSGFESLEEVTRWIRFSQALD